MRWRGGDFFYHDVMIDREDLIEPRKINRYIINDQKSNSCLQNWPRMFYNVRMTRKLHDLGQTYPVMNSANARVNVGIGYSRSL